MPPKGARPAAIKARQSRTRMQRREARATTEQLNRLDLDASESTVQPSSSGGPRNNPRSANPVVSRNYEPTVDFSAIKVLIVLCYGSRSQQFPDIELQPFQTTMGRANSTAQIHGLVRNNDEALKALNERYNLRVPNDIVGTTISFTDAAQYRHEVPYESRYDGMYSIWSGEVEAGILPAEAQCLCNEHDDYDMHGVVIRIKFGMVNTSKDSSDHEDNQRPFANTKESK